MSEAGGMNMNSDLIAAMAEIEAYRATIEGMRAANLAAELEGQTPPLEPEDFFSLAHGLQDLANSIRGYGVVSSPGESNM